MSLFTLVHVAISLIGIVSGFVALRGLIGNRLYPCWTRWFLATTILTSATGFFFPNLHFTPAVKVGILSLVLLAVACYALYGRGLAGGWRRAYVVTATLSLYLNTFVLVAQLFQKVPALKALAPTGSEPPFAAAQGVVLLVFLVLGILAFRRFRDTPSPATP
jgi:hypothetical protein